MHPGPPFSDLSLVPKFRNLCTPSQALGSRGLSHKGVFQEALVRQTLASHWLCSEITKVPTNKPCLSEKWGRELEGGELGGGGLVAAVAASIAFVAATPFKI